MRWLVAWLRSVMGPDDPHQRDWVDNTMEWTAVIGALVVIFTVSTAILMEVVR